MNSAVPRPWEVWHARFDFEGGRGYKFRPVIILGTQDDETVVMMVTSSTNKLRMEHDHLLLDWGAAGLEKPSIARIDRIAAIPAAYFGAAGKIGRLAEIDIAAIAAALSKM